SDALSRVAGRDILLKPEHRKRTGSYKIRGAYNRISRLDPGGEVVAASAGNHAQGVALAATLTRLRSTIFMPANAPLPKGEAIRAGGMKESVAAKRPVTLDRVATMADGIAVQAVSELTLTHVMA